MSRFCALTTRPACLLSLLLLLVSGLDLTLCQQQSPVEADPGGDDTVDSGDDSLPYLPPAQTGDQSNAVDSQTSGNPRSYALRPFLSSEAKLQAAAPVELTNPADRYSDFLRVRRGGTFLRIGKDQAQGDDGNDGLTGSLHSADKRQMHRFIRIGRTMFDGGEDDAGNALFAGRDDGSQADAAEFDRVRKAPSSFVRIGKAPSSFVRIGKAPSSFVRIGKAPSSFVRIGKAPSSFVRIGKAPSSFVRIGKAPSSFVRIGRASNPDPTMYSDKRASSFVRIGKDLPLYQLADAVKRSSSFVRIGKSHSDIEDTSDDSYKRASSFVRIGRSRLADDDFDGEGLKRASSFVRIGKSHPTNAAPHQDDKRAGNFLRIGRSMQEAAGGNSGSNMEAQKRGFVRIGKKENSKRGSAESLKDSNPIGDDRQINLATRGSGFVRIGKIPSSAFVRIGKNSNIMLAQDPVRVYPYRRSRAGQSSFVRIGRK